MFSPKDHTGRATWYLVRARDIAEDGHRDALEFERRPSDRSDAVCRIATASLGLCAALVEVALDELRGDDLLRHGKSDKLPPAAALPLPMVLGAKEPK